MSTALARPACSRIALRRGLFAFGALLVGINVASALWSVRADRARVEQDALRNFSNLTALLAEQTAGSLGSVDLLLDAAASDMRATGMGEPAARETRLRDRISGVPQVRSLLLVGPDGRVLVDTAGQIPGGLDLSDRTYFTAHRDGAAGGRFVSEPFEGRASGHWEFAVSERIADGADRFAGVLVAKMDIAYFERLYRSLDIGGGGFVGLITTSGTPITRVPGPREAFEPLDADPDGVLAALKRDGRFAGWSLGAGRAEPAPVLISAAAIPDRPLNVVVSAPERAVLAPWREEAVRIGVRTLLTSAAMLALIALAARELARRAAADERVQQSEERYALAVAGANDGIWDRDLVADRMYYSRRALELLGVDPPIEGFRPFEEWETLIDFHPEDLPRRRAAMAQHIAGATPFYEGEWRVRHADGAYRWVKSRGLCTRGADGRATRLAGSVTDIEERKRYEGALRGRQEMLDLAQQAAHAAAFEWLIGAGAAVNRCSPELERMHGLAPGTYDGTYETWRDLVHPPDLPALNAALERARRTGDFAAEYRVVHADGSVHWIQAKGRMFADADGSPGRLVGFMLDVTDQRHAEAELHRQTVVLDELITSAPEAIIMYDADWRVVRVNREFTRLFGYAVDEVVGTDMTKRLTPGDRAAEVDDARRRLGLGEHVSLETVRQHKDGTLLEVSALGAPIWVGGERIGAFLIFRDISERKRNEAELLRQTVLLDELFESGPEAVVLLDLDGRVIRTNREFGVTFGYAAEEAAGRLIFELIVPEDQLESSHGLKAVVMSGERATIECERRRKDGTRIHVSLMGAPIMLGGKLIGMFALYRDISERKLAEAEQARLQTRLRQAEKMEAVGRLAGGIAHDFNNILGGILGYGEMVFAEAAEGTRMKRYARNVLTAANRARDLVDQILTYSRSQHANRVPVEIDRVVKETLELVRGSLAAGIALDLALPAAPQIVIGDPTQLHQVVMNLCTNALHAMSGSGTLRVALEAADIAAERVLAHGTLAPGRYVRLTVADTGSGMDAATLARAFEPFFTTKEVGRGTGLGLSLIYGIVTDSGGAIHLASEVGRGTTFEIYLPRAEVRAIIPEAADGPVPRGNGERVLLVDDEEPLIAMTAEVLTQLGYRAAPFTDGRTALEAFEETPEAFQVLVTDEVMPALTGTELARRVRHLRPNLPVVLVSGYSGPILKQRALGAGISELLKKPVQSRELAAALARALHRAP